VNGDEHDAVGGQASRPAKQAVDAYERSEVWK
jgi:hypothetical protein